MPVAAERDVVDLEAISRCRMCSIGYWRGICFSNTSKAFHCRAEPMTERAPAACVRRMPAIVLLNLHYSLHLSGRAPVTV